MDCHRPLEEHITVLFTSQAEKLSMTHAKNCY